MVWDDVRYFLAVARQGSVRRAAAHLGVNHSTVSRRVRQLEDSHGVRLFEPSPGGFRLTHVGEQVLELAQQIELDMGLLAERLSDRDAAVTGTVTLSIGDNFVTRWAPLFARLRAAYPALELTVRVGSAPVDLSDREVDIAIRLSNASPEPMVGRRLATMAMALYASRRYLAQHRGMLSPADLDWIGWDASWNNAYTRWMAERVPAGRVACRVDSPAALYEMTRAGLGAAHLLCYLGDADPDLVRVEPELAEFSAGLWLITHPEIRSTARVRSVIDFIEEELHKETELMEGRLRGPVRARSVPDPHLPIR